MLARLDCAGETKHCCTKRVRKEKERRSQSFLMDASPRLVLCVDINKTIVISDLASKACLLCVLQ